MISCVFPEEEEEEEEEEIIYMQQNLHFIKYNYCLEKSNLWCGVFMILNIAGPCKTPVVPHTDSFMHEMTLATKRRL